MAVMVSVRALPNRFNASLRPPSPKVGRIGVWVCLESGTPVMGTIVALERGADMLKATILTPNGKTHQIRVV